MNQLKALNRIHLWERLAVAASLILLVQVALWLGWLPSMVPSAGEVGLALWNAVTSADFWLAISRTMMAAVIGWLIGSAAGILAGLIIGSVRILDESTSVLIDFGRSFPIIALMPVVVLLLGQNSTMEIVLVALGCLWPVLVQTIYGVRRLDTAVMETTRIFMIPTVLRFRRVLLPAATPFIATGVRLAASIAILVAVAVEVLTQTPGIGREITIAQEVQRWDWAFAYLFVAGLIGWLVAVGLELVERVILRWNRLSDD